MNRRTIYGVLILAVGVLALAGSLGYIEINGGLWFTFWPVILLAIGLVNLLDEPKNYFFSGVMLLLGGVFLARNLGVELFRGLDFWGIFWPLVIIAVGLQLMTSRGRGSIFGHRQTVSGDDLDIVRIFSGGDVSVESQDFTGGDVVTIFGGADVDLRNAQIKGKPAKMDVVTIFGGANIIVPEGWKVKVTGVPIFGGWSNRTAMKGQDQVIDLEISGVSIFGGFDIKN